MYGGQVHACFLAGDHSAAVPRISAECRPCEIDNASAQNEGTLRSHVAMCPEPRNSRRHNATGLRQARAPSNNARCTGPPASHDGGSARRIHGVVRPSAVSCQRQTPVPEPPLTAPACTEEPGLGLIPTRVPMHLISEDVGALKRGSVHASTMESSCARVRNTLDGKSTVNSRCDPESGCNLLRITRRAS